MQEAGDFALDLEEFLKQSELATGLSGHTCFLVT